MVSFLSWYNRFKTGPCPSVFALIQTCQEACCPTKIDFPQVHSQVYRLLSPRLMCLRLFVPQKPYTAVTVSIENLTSETYDEEDFSGIPELVEVIMIQASGPTEA